MGTQQLRSIIKPFPDILGLQLPETIASTVFVQGFWELKSRFGNLYLNPIVNPNRDRLTESII